MKDEYIDNYAELSALIQYEEDLTVFFSEKRDYKAILDQAIVDEHYEAIKALSTHLPLNDWFDKEYIFNKFKTSMNESYSKGNLYGWCMTIPEIRKCFTPREKGYFLYTGFSLKNHTMAYCSTLDNDWEINLPENIVILELERLSQESKNSQYKKNIELDYIHWFEEQIFPKISEKNQVVYMLGLLNISVGQLRMISENKNLAEIGFYIHSEEEKENPFEKIDKIEKELKNVINHLQNELCFHNWPNDLKYKFAGNNIGYIPKGAIEIINKNGLNAFADQLTTLINYRKLNNELHKNDLATPRKLKI
jgi:hypothetical protein